MHLSPASASDWILVLSVVRKWIYVKEVVRRTILRTKWFGLNAPFFEWTEDERWWTDELKKYVGKLRLLMNLEIIEKFVRDLIFKGEYFKDH